MKKIKYKNRSSHMQCACIYNLVDNLPWSPCGGIFHNHDLCDISILGEILPEALWNNKTIWLFLARWEIVIINVFNDIQGWTLLKKFERYISLVLKHRIISFSFKEALRNVVFMATRNCHFLMKVSFCANTCLTKCCIVTEIQIIPPHRHLSAKVRAEDNTEDHWR